MTTDQYAIQLYKSLSQTYDVVLLSAPFLGASLACILKWLGEFCLFIQIKKASFADDNFSISVSKSANEVVATYTKDETGMDLVIRLPPSYPLRPVDVDCTRSLGITEVKRRKWLMSLMSFVRNQVFPTDSSLVPFSHLTFFLLFVFFFDIVLSVIYDCTHTIWIYALNCLKVPSITHYVHYLVSLMFIAVYFWHQSYQLFHFMADRS